ncbi:MAG: hypothetical protein DRP46_01675 [Candidatus Zixiibacteriota bacterium]|nr:MAG: hypothetical protein DRP46_01675 [candidate division Zixibacteria bacterium]
MSRFHNIFRQTASLVFLISIILCANAGAALKVLKADQIKSRIKIHDGPIVNGSDSLIADDIRLSREGDYNIDYLEGVIFLTTPADSIRELTVYFTPLPSWLKKQYGILPDIGDSPPPIRSLPAEHAGPRRMSDASAMKIRGAKKFSVISQTGGTSQFDQSLEMTINGEITPGLTVSGSVADRGYDPSYGAINSQISELDKLNLKISSKNFYSEIGDLEYNQLSGYNGPNIKQVSGITAALTAGNYNFGALFGRPRGKFRTVRFRGQDRIQGPYQITSGNTIEAVVPGSEKIWVDGKLLDRGADKDYIMDYPAATVTFTPKVLIDSRSRIEVDFEPLTTDYQREIYSVSGGTMAGDSSLYLKIDFTREGDDRDRLKTGELSAGDIGILQNIGDSISSNYKDGAVYDTTGAYLERFDSTGYRFFEYVGDSLGDYRVNFSPVGDGNGDYLFDGGDIYRYVGRNQGNYLPIILIPVPEREDFLETELGIRPGKNSRLKVIMKQSNYDRNLYSNLDDNNNTGGQYIFSAGIGESPSLHSNQSGVDISANIINKNFKARSRRKDPDLERNYLIPTGLQPKNDERNYKLASSLIIPGPFNVHFNSGLLDYKDIFKSYYGAVTIIPDMKSSLFPRMTYRCLKAEYDSAGTVFDGESELYSAGLNYDINGKTGAAAAFSHDRRWNEYSGSMRGTTEIIYNLSARYGPARVEFERYDEDTLIIDWINRLTRYQGKIGLVGRIKAINGEIYLTGKRSTRNDLTEEQFLGRVKISYAPSGQNLAVSGSYALSDENRFERGVRYIEVESGEGQYILMDSQYIPDPDGNYIEIEEIHSTQAQVSRGEKSLQLSYNPDDIYFRMTANTIEELLDEGDRNLLWVLPLYSDGSQPYLLRRLYYREELKILNYGGYYFAGLTSSYNYESRRVGGSDYEKYKTDIKASFNEASGEWRFIQEGAFFKDVRDDYYSSPGNIDGFSIKVSVIRRLTRGQINSSVIYRYAEDEGGADSRQYIASISPRLRLIAGGETSLKIEGYLQDLDSDGFVLYRLTSNRYGEKGVNWSVRSDYKVRKDLRINFSFSGRHSNNRKPRIIGRGEVIANF